MVGGSGLLLHPWIAGSFGDKLPTTPKRCAPYTMKAYRNYAWIMLLLLASCATMPVPETNTERLFFLKTSFDELLNTAQLYQNEGRFTADQAKQVSASLHDIDNAIDTADAALTLLDQGAFDDSTRAINTGLTLLRKILVEAET